MNKEQQHWDSIYTLKVEDELSWFQPYPKTSIEFLKLYQMPLTANIIDIGGGDSHFVDALLEKGLKKFGCSTFQPKRLKERKIRSKSLSSTLDRFRCNRVCS